MKKSDALPGNYLRQEDISEPLLVTVDKVTLEVLENDRGKDNKPIMYFSELGRGLVLNATNWDACETGFSEPDSDGWTGKKVVLFVDPSVTFGSKRVGGIRIRMPRNQRREEEERAAAEFAGADNHAEVPF